MKRVLIIDDEPAVCSMLRHGFEQAGFEVHTAENGTQGLALVHQQLPDLVVTDLLMPEKDGLEIIREIHREYPGMKVIAMSGGHRAELDFLVEAQLFGAAHAIAKPFAFSTLMALVQDSSMNSSG